MKNSNVVIPAGYVLIPMERYDELLDTESRVDLLVEQARREPFFDRQDMYLTLGYLQDWEKLEQEKQERNMVWAATARELKESGIAGEAKGETGNENYTEKAAAGEL